MLFERCLDRRPYRIRSLHQRKMLKHFHSELRFARVHPCLSPLSRSASILCPRLSLEATVPMEQCSAFAICSYERSSKYRSNTAIRNFGGSADTAARTDFAICARA